MARILLSLVVITSLLTVGTAQAAPLLPAGILHVTTLSDSGPGSLRDSIIQLDANASITAINIDNGGIITLTSPLPAVTNDVTITGLGAANLTISGDSKYRIFTFNAANVTLSGMTLVYGYATGSPAEGGAILNSSHLTITGVVFLDNVVQGDAGTGGNVMTGGNGGLGGAIYSTGQMTIGTATFTGNQAVGGAGGTDGNGFNGGGGGGAGLGGAIFTTAPDSFMNVTFNWNIAAGGNGGQGSFGGGGGAGMGGAVFNNGGVISFTNTTFAGNQAKGGSGGGDTGGGGGQAGGAGGFGEGGGSLSAGGFGGGGGGCGNTGTVAGNGGYAGGGGGCSGTSALGGGGLGGDGGYGGGGGGAAGGTYASNLSPSTVHFFNSTLASNSTAAGVGGGLPTGQNGQGQGGGIYAFPGATVFLSQSLVATNTPVGAYADVAGIINSMDYNLVGIIDGSSGLTGANDLTGTAALPLDPLLDPLADNGGPTQTMALQFRSPAVDHIPMASCTTLVDQRGIVRPQGRSCDVGAFELVLHFDWLPVVHK